MGNSVNRGAFHAPALTDIYSIGGSVNHYHEIWCAWYILPGHNLPAFHKPSAEAFLNANPKRAQNDLCHLGVGHWLFGKVGLLGGKKDATLAGVDGWRAMRAADETRIQRSSHGMARLRS